MQPRWLLLSMAMLAVGVPIAAASPPDPANGRFPDSLAGDWQTVIESPVRPWIFVVHLRHSGAAWSGVMSVEGLADFPLGDVRVDSTQVRFRFPPELDAIPFEGTAGRDGILGRVVEQGRPVPTRLTRIVPLPRPANRLEAWRQDVDAASARLIEYDRSFTSRTREACRTALALLRRDLPRMDDAQILVALSRAVALADNAHTRLRLDPTLAGSFASELPLRSWWFDDGPHVVRAASAYRRALGCRVVAIEGHGISEVRDRVATLFAGNASWASYLAPIYMTSPDVLHGLGLAASRDVATFTLEDEHGVRFDLPIRAEPIDPDTRADESWQELSPATPVGQPRWASALAAATDRLPLYLRHPDRPYWFEDSPRSGLLYFQYNRAQQDERGPAFRAFMDSLMAAVRNPTVRTVIVDLRFNSGGDLEIGRESFLQLARQMMLDPRVRWFVVTGRCTFSAGLYHAAQLKQFGRATFVGEPIGDRLDYWAEGGRIVLPNSHAVIEYANGFHRYSGRNHPESRPYYAELSVPSLEPDIPTPMSYTTYASGRDPALEAIEARTQR